MKNSFYENLNYYQKKAVSHIDGPLIIFAGAGTGKTRVITNRIANLIFSGVSSNSIIALTFTNKAAYEMKQRVNCLLCDVKLSNDICISTFHSFCANFLRIESLNIDINPNFLIYDFIDQKNIVIDCLKEMNFDKKNIKISNIIDQINYAKDNLKLPLDMLNFCGKNINYNNFVVNFFDIYNMYQKKLNRFGALDFGDLILKTVFELKKNSSLLNFYQNKYKYIMVDEYQDVNFAQYTFVNLLAKIHRNICVVGDDDQSIYSWRGADVNNILNFKKDYFDTKSIKLEQNYRSTPKILYFAQKLIDNNINRVSKKIWTNNLNNGVVSIIETLNEYDEAEQISNIISLNVLNGGCKFSDFSVFYRTNIQARVFEDEFRRKKIPYNIVGSIGFYDRSEIKDIISYLKFIYNTNDNISFKRIINNPRRGFGKTSLNIIESFAESKNISIWESIKFLKDIKLTNKATNILIAFSQFIKKFIESKNKFSVKEIVIKIIYDSEYLKKLEIEDNIVSRSKIENIKELIESINNFENSVFSDKSLSGYLTNLSLIDDFDSFNKNILSKVTLMTLHLAKGLEFKNVFLCGLEDGLFPNESNLNSINLEEERRLMYVGMTRAMENLYLCWAKKRTIYGKTKFNFPSRFILETDFYNYNEKSCNIIF
jgi:DNA helicase-2/ATP-dependent DNA helicase PcrA